MNKLLRRDSSLIRKSFDKFLGAPDAVKEYVGPDGFWLRLTVLDLLMVLARFLGLGGLGLG